MLWARPFDWMHYSPDIINSLYLLRKSGIIMVFFLALYWFGIIAVYKSGRVLTPYWTQALLNLGNLSFHPEEANVLIDR